MTYTSGTYICPSPQFYPSVIYNLYVHKLILSVFGPALFWHFANSGAKLGRELGGGGVGGE